jgi:hypothetical protein
MNHNNCEGDGMEWFCQKVINISLKVFLQAHNLFNNALNKAGLVLLYCCGQKLSSLDVQTHLFIKYA